MQNPISLGPSVEPAWGDCCALLGQRFIMKPADLAVGGQEHAVTLKGKRGGLSTQTLDYNAVTHRASCLSPWGRAASLSDPTLRQQIGPLPLVFGRGCLLGLLLFLRLAQRSLDLITMAEALGG